MQENGEGHDKAGHLADTQSREDGPAKATHSLKVKKKTALRSYIMLLCCTVPVLVALVAFLYGSRGPSYQGENISQWLAWFDSPRGLSQPEWMERYQKRTDAAHALRQMGPDVFPHLRRMLQPDSRPKKFLSKLRKEFKKDYDQVGQASLPSPEEARMLRAVEASSYLGPDAQAMVPDLILTMKNNPRLNVRSRAAYALGEIRRSPETVVPALLESLNKMNDSNVLISLGKYGPEARSAVPALIGILEGIEASASQSKPINNNILCEASHALHQIAPDEAKKKLSLLQDILQRERDPNWQAELKKIVDIISGAARRAAPIKQ